ncbi:MAG: Fic family protein [Maricaulaceae bacterium]
MIVLEEPQCAIRKRKGVEASRASATPFARHAAACETVCSDQSTVDRILPPSGLHVQGSALLSRLVERSDAALSKWTVAHPAAEWTERGLAEALVRGELDLRFETEGRRADHPIENLRPFSTRPDPRPATLALAEAISARRLSISQFERAVRALTDGAVTRVRRSGVRLRIHGPVPPRRFCPAQDVGGHLDRLLDVIAAPSMERVGVQAAASVMGQFQAIHPFTDGNGRVARALFNAWLMAQGKLATPLPLGPLIRHNNALNRSALFHAERSGTWDPFVGFCAMLVDGFINHWREHREKDDENTH